MALWNKISSDFNPDDETINYGTRLISKNNGSIYETTTIVTIQSNVQVEKVPHISPSLQHGKLCIAIDKSFILFEDVTCQKILLNISFETSISCYCITKDGAFSFVVLNSQELCCVNLLNGGNIVFSKELTSVINNVHKVLLIFTEETDKIINIYLVLSNGTLYRTSELCKNDIKSINIEEKEDVNNLKHSILFNEIFKMETQEEIVFAISCYILRKLSIIMLGLNSITIWSDNIFNSINLGLPMFIKVRYLEKHNALLCLGKNYTLSKMCPFTLIKKPIYYESVQDFVPIYNANNKELQILVLMKPMEQTAKIALRLLTYPGSIQIFQIFVSNTTCLIDIPINFDGDIVILENSVGKEIILEECSTIKLKALVENDPKYCLQKLLRKQLFEEAFSFANKFQLSTESIYCAKVTAYLNKFNSSTKELSESINLHLLMDDLNKINNVEYIANCCTKVILSDYTETKKILLYAQQRIMKDTKNMENIKNITFLTLIHNTIYKLETFELLRKIQENHESSENITDWMHFLKTDLLEECKILLHSGNLKSTSLIWTRHFPDIIPKISESNVLALFQEIPDDVSLPDLILWLSYLIPPLLFSKPNTMSGIINWAYKKTESLEKQFDTFWPEVGIEFMTSFLNILKSKTINNLNCILEWHINHDSALQQFMKLLQILNELGELKSNHKIRIALMKYTSESMEVAHLLLSKVRIEEMPNFVDKFLRQYMYQNSLDNDTVLSLFIKKLIASTKNWWKWEEAPWERKAACIILFVQDVQTRLALILEVLKRAPVPWDPSVSTLAEENSTVNHFLAEKIRIEINCVPVKLILKKYGFEHVGLCDKLISRILKENRPDMLDDIDVLTKNNLPMRIKIFFQCAKNFLICNNIDELLKVFNMLEEDIALNCYNILINYILIYISKDRTAKHFDVLEILGWINYKISTMHNLKSHLKSNYMKKIDEIRFLYLLKPDFGVQVTYDMYKNYKEDVLSIGISNLVYSLGNETLTISSAMDLAGKLTVYLQRKKVEGTIMLYNQVKTKEALKYFVESLDETSYSEDFSSLRIVCLETLVDIDVDEDVIEYLRIISNLLLNNIKDEHIESALMLNNFLLLFGECTINKSLIFKNKGLSRETSENYKIYSIYKQNTFVPKDFLRTLLLKQLEYYEIVSAVELINKSTIRRSNLLFSFINCVKAVNEESIDYQWLMVVLNLYKIYVCYNETREIVIKEFADLSAFIATNILNRILNVRSFDFQLGLACLSLLSMEKESEKWLTSQNKFYQVDYKRRIILCSLALGYGKLIKNEVIKTTFNNTRITYSWAKKLSPYLITHKQIREAFYKGKKDIVERIVQRKQNEHILPLLLEFCTTFDFDKTECLLIYLLNLVKTWNPTLNELTIEGNKTLHISSKEVDKLKEECDSIVMKITDKVILDKFITDILPRVNFYHYEVLLILMSYKENKYVRNKCYLEFLKTYTRQKPPTEFEENQWRNSNSENISLPLISKWRLPYLPKDDSWTVISAELNLNTYQKWLQITPALGYATHSVCVLAVKGEATLVWKKDNTNSRPNEWLLYKKQNSLLNDIRKCLSLLSNEQLCYAAAALYFVISCAPPGADKVAVAKECYMFAEKAINLSDNFEDGLFEKVKSTYFKLAVEHTLRSHYLNTEYLRFIQDPLRLIRALYMDENIPLRYSSVTNDKPNINLVAKTLCNLFSLNWLKIQIELLDEWIQLDPKFEDVTSDQNINYDNINDDNLLRACYILEGCDRQLFANYLINTSFNDKDERFSVATRYRALYVLQSITDTETLQNLTKRSITFIRQYMKSLEYSSQLQYFGSPYSTFRFVYCSKQQIIDILNKLDYNSPQVLLFITKVCLDFNIDDFDIWDETLEKMTTLSMDNNLKQIILQVRNLSQIANCKSYVSAWQMIISKPFKNLDLSNTPEIIEDCIKSIGLLYSCPILSKLCFTHIIQHCFEYNMPHFGAVLLPFLKNNDKDLTLQKLKDLPDLMSVMDSLKKISPERVLTVSYSIKVIEEMISEREQGNLII